MIYIVTLVGGFKCPRKINLNTQCTGQGHTSRIFFSSPSSRVQTRRLPFWRHMHIKLSSSHLDLQILVILYQGSRSKERNYRFTRLWNNRALDSFL